MFRGKNKILVFHKIEQIWEVKVAQFWDWDWCTSLQWLVLSWLGFKSSIYPGSARLCWGSTTLEFLRWARLVLCKKWDWWAKAGSGSVRSKVVKLDPFGSIYELRYPVCTKTTQLWAPLSYFKPFLIIFEMLKSVGSLLVLEQKCQSLAGSAWLANKLKI
jgi:hypothetical protein